MPVADAILHVYFIDHLLDFVDECNDECVIYLYYLLNRTPLKLKRKVIKKDYSTNSVKIQLSEQVSIGQFSCKK